MYGGRLTNALPHRDDNGGGEEIREFETVTHKHEIPRALSR